MRFLKNDGFKYTFHIQLEPLERSATHGHVHERDSQRRAERPRATRVRPVHRQLHARLLPRRRVSRGEDDNRVEPTRGSENLPLFSLLTVRRNLHTPSFIIILHDVSSKPTYPTTRRHPHFFAKRTFA